MSGLVGETLRHADAQLELETDEAVEATRGCRNQSSRFLRVDSTSPISET